MEQENIGIIRLCGFYGDPNFYSAQIVTAFGGLLLVVANKKKNNVLHIVLAIVLFFCGATSLSKSFLISILLVLVFWLFTILRHNPSKPIGAIFGFVLTFAILFFVGAFDNIVEQYTVRFDSVTDASDLTTGRTDLWLEYLRFMFTNPIDLFFGQGYTSVFNGVHKGSHNTLIQLLYQFGIIGVVFIVSWLGSFANKDNKTNKRPLILLVWGISCFFMWLGLDMLFCDDFFVNIMLFALGCNYFSRTGVK